MFFRQSRATQKTTQICKLFQKLKFNFMCRNVINYCNISSPKVAFESPLPAAAQSKGSSNTFYGVLKMTTSGKERVYKVGDVVKLDTKPVMYGKVLRFVQAGKKGETIDKVVVLRQPAEVPKKLLLLQKIHS